MDDTDLRRFLGRTVADRYTLTDWIGGGAFGGVFRSEQHILGQPVRRVAFKLSRRAGMTEENARELFADVLLLAQAMDGMTDAEARRHLVHVYDGGLAQDAGGRAFLAMEYVQGTTLAAQFASLRRVPASLMFKWVRQVCVALRGLHTLVPPLLHRDLKPDNVLLGMDGTVRLIDFGLAARLLKLGHVPGVAGTLRYMAPETSDGESVPASDLYSLGLLMYEGLTGIHPFGHLVPPPEVPDAAHGAWLRDQKRRITPAPPSTLNNTADGAADDVVLSCLQYDPARRYRSAGDLVDVLDALATGPRRPRPRPGERALEEAVRLAAQGDPAGARRVLLRCLDTEQPPPAVRLAVLEELARSHGTAGDPAATARCLADAWQLVKDSALLRTRDERCALLARVEDAYRRAGNGFQAEHFARLRHREQGTG
ncbi:serine/threonine-protein kinase [Streptomyces acidicola]|uniref:serine/threonine-protein kinase n=1 Tax=Streptomyces acidicola TaxID=2596892 RepID=UPI003421E1A0